jgi:RNA polymerase sigma factor (sigma-70 family)
MATAGLARVLDHLRKTLNPTELTALTDRQLLSRFVAARDEAAFAALVARHGNMVLGVCRRLLRCEQDAEDAFQATFLVLARKAGAIGWGDCAGPWLHEVAIRTALEARSAITRRRAWERQDEVLPHPLVAPIEPCDWRPLLDQELRRLPEKYRTAVILCALEGRSRREAALLLGVQEGTLSSRLASARKMLAERLTRRGVTLSAGALAVFSESATAATLSPDLVRSTITVATLVAAGLDAAGTATSTVLMKGVLKAMFFQKLKWTAVVMMATVVLGAGGFVYQAGNGPAAARAQAPATKPVSELEALRKEMELLRLNLQVVLEKVRAQEAEIRELKGQRALIVPGQWDPDTVKALGFYPPARALVVKAKVPANPLQEIDDALKQLREAKDKEAKRRAAELLEKATKKLREQLKDGSADPKAIR